jgi:hypothetical protein
MTTQATTVQHSKREILGLISTTVFTFAVLGGVALWQVWPSGQAAAPTTSATTSAVRSPADGGLPSGGLAERYDEMRAAATVRESITVVPEPESPLNAPVGGSTGEVMDRDALQASTCGLTYTPTDC